MQIIDECNAKEALMSVIETMMSGNFIDNAIPAYQEDDDKLVFVCEGNAFEKACMTQLILLSKEERRELVGYAELKKAAKKDKLKRFGALSYENKTKNLAKIDQKKGFIMSLVSMSFERRNFCNGEVLRPDNRIYKKIEAEVSINTTLH